MAWIEYHTELRDHWKVQRLADKLQYEYPHALGIISCLWLWVAQYSPKGDLSRFSDSEIRVASRCLSENFSKNTLKECSLLDDKERIKDWRKTGLKLLESSRSRQKKYREKLRNAHATVTSTIPNLTNHTIPNQPDLTKKSIGRFAPPTLDEIKIYCVDRKNQVDTNKFHAFYESKGWMVGKNKMKDWKAAVRTWESSKSTLTDTQQRNIQKFKEFEAENDSGRI